MTVSFLKIIRRKNGIKGDKSWATLVCGFLFFSVVIISFGQPSYTAVEGDAAQVTLQLVHGKLATNMDFFATVQTMNETARGM